MVFMATNVKNSHKSARQRQRTQNKIGQNIGTREFLTGQWVYEKVTKIGTAQKGTNLNHNEISLQSTPHLKRLTMA